VPLGLALGWFRPALWAINSNYISNITADFADCLDPGRDFVVSRGRSRTDLPYFSRQRFSYHTVSSVAAVPKHSAGLRARG